MMSAPPSPLPGQAGQRAFGAWQHAASAFGRHSQRLRQAGWLLLWLASLSAAGLAQAAERAATSGTNSVQAGRPNAASTVYRCGAGQYSQTPCAGGQAMPTAPTPDAQQQRATRLAAQRQAQMADRLRDERQQQAQLAARQQPIRIGPEPSEQDKQRKRRAHHPAAPPADSNGPETRRNSSRTKPVASPDVPRAAQRGPAPPAQRKAYAPSPAKP